MPTKPVTTYTFATDALFLAGPAIGLATRIIPPSLGQGFVPGTGIAAEHINYLHNIVGAWVTDWLALGTSAADEDAHIVETDGALGRINAARVSIGGGTVGGPLETANIRAPSAGGGEAALFFNSFDGTRVTVGIDHNVAASTAAALQVRQLNGTGLAVEVFGANGGTAVKVDSDAATTADRGLFIDVTGTDGSGLSIATVDGRCLNLTNGNGARAPLRISPRDEPVSPLSGDIYVDNDASAPRLGVYLDAAWRSVWATDGGLIHGYAETLAESNTSAGGTLSSKATITLTLADDIEIGDVIHLRGICETGADGANSSMQIGFRDITNGVDFAVRSVRHFQSTGDAAERYNVIEAEYTAVSAGVQQFSLGFISNGANTVYIQNASIEITGIYD